ncbi:HDL285Wp [Eremothecium sinecaudum]|uniref:HDL285Wp n=1 Tax=Eremothecium sinecaudum TaxID=45286 RepID=A0A0X8HS43_9SACH|nr:HDL285Wp [Eremothecium sinecaudum]AMD20459.1 HDL285Wp [Eremothecium sinecaudum]
MQLFTHPNRNRQPTFLLHLEIQELSNIPQSSGSCYVKWQLKDGTGTSVRRKDSAAGSQGGSNQSKGITEKVLVNNHRARWNYRLDPPATVKLGLDKNRILGSKILTLQIYFEFLDDFHRNSLGGPGGLIQSPIRSPGSPASVASSGNVYTKNMKGKLLLGTISTDLVDYVNESQETVTNRLLLQKSKINSILTLRIRMQLLRGNFEDYNWIVKHHSKSRIGLNEILEDSSEVVNMIPGHHTNSMRISTPSVKNGSNSASENGAYTPLRRGQKGDKLNAVTFTNPLIEKLYQKTFELSWDPQPGELTPRECVEDIIEGGNGWARNEWGISLVELRKLEMQEYDGDGFIHSLRMMHIQNSLPDSNADLFSYIKNDRKFDQQGREDTRVLSARQRKHLRNRSRRGTSAQSPSPEPDESIQVAGEQSPPATNNRSWKVNNILP